MAALMLRSVESHAFQSCSSSSDSSDDQTEPVEQLQRFQEAAVTADYFSGFTKWKKSGTSLTATQDSQRKSHLPSKRSVNVNDHEDENAFGTTPEFRAFVSKKLAQKLDREIEFCTTETPVSEYADWVHHDTKAIKEGVRLFSDSSHVLCDTDEAPSKTPQPYHRRLARTSVFDGCEAERLASVAVTADFLAQERAMWARLRQSSQTAEKPEVMAVIIGSSVRPCSASQHEIKTKDTSSPLKTQKKIKTKDTSSPLKTQKKGKKRKKAKKSDDEMAGSVGNDLNSGREYGFRREKTDQVDRKKKRKRKDSSVSRACVSENDLDRKVQTDNTSVNCDEHEPVKKKKKQKIENSVPETCGNQLNTLAEIPSMRTAVGPQNDDSGEHQNQKKKKKHKNIDENKSVIVENCLSIPAEGKTVTDIENENCNVERSKKKKKKHKNIEDITPGIIGNKHKIKTESCSVQIAGDTDNVSWGELQRKRKKKCRNVENDASDLNCAIEKKQNIKAESGLMITETNTDSVTYGEQKAKKKKKHKKVENGSSHHHNKFEQQT